MELLTKALSILYQQYWCSGEVGKCDTELQEWPEGGSGELQISQPDLGTWEGHRADCPHECRRVARAGQPGDQAQTAQVWETQVLLGQPDLL